MPLSCGIPELDRIFDGGIPEGSLIVGIVPPGLQHDPLLAAGAGERKSLFFTTVKREWAITKEFERADGPVNIDTIIELEPEDATDEIPSQIVDLGKDFDFYVDAIDRIEENVAEESYIDLLNTMSERLHESESIGYLYGYNADTIPYNRRYTLDIADVVLRLRAIQDRSQIDYYLEIPKAKGVPIGPKDRFHEIDVSDRITVDETRNIG